MAPQTKRYDEAFKRQAVENWAGHPYDHAALENFMATYPADAGRVRGTGRSPGRLRHARRGVFDGIEKYCNRVRTHSALGYQTPVDFEHRLN